MSRIAEALQKAGKSTEIASRLTPSEGTMASFPSAEPENGPPGVVPLLANVADSAVAFNPTRALERSREALRADERLVTAENGDPIAAQQFRKLASTLHQLQLERQLHLVLVCSAVTAEGKTLTAVNLALTFSESFRRKVLLVDADLRKPMLDSVFGVEPAHGLSDVLRSVGDETVPLVTISDHLSLLGAGRRDPDPVGGFTSSRMRDLLQAAAQEFDWVIIDSPPVGLVPDASLLSSLVDGVLVVIGASMTPAGVVKKAVQALPEERIIGVVLNRAERMALANYGYYGGYRHTSDDSLASRPTDPKP